MPRDPVALLRSRSYLALLALAAMIGVPISAACYFFLALVTKLQGWIFTSLPDGLGFDGEPLWWPAPLLALAGVLVGLAIVYLPGTGGRSPADGFKAGEGAPTPIELPGVVLAALATLSLGVVLGPEAPLIALGGGLGVCAVRLIKRGAPARTSAVVAAAGSFAAISTLFGSPLLGAFLLMEASGIAGAALELVLMPGLLAAGVGSLIFIGLDAWTGLGTFSLAIPDLAERFPRRACLPGHVHRCRGRDSAVAPAGADARSRRRDGHRRNVRGDAPPPDDLRPAGHPVAVIGRPGRHAADDRGGRGGLRGIGQAHASPGPGPGSAVSDRQGHADRLARPHACGRLGAVTRQGRPGRGPRRGRQVPAEGRRPGLAVRTGG